MITFTQKGDFSKANNYFERLKEIIHVGVLDKYGQQGVDALASVTPRETGRTAASWRYEIERNNNGSSINFYNDNIQNGVPIAIILQYGHGTRNGGYVQGIDYINPAIRPIFEQISEESWKEVTSL